MTFQGISRQAQHTGGRKDVRHAHALAASCRYACACFTRLARKAQMRLRMLHQVGQESEAKEVPVRCG